jgi:hypothetical protein
LKPKQDIKIDPTDSKGDAALMGHFDTDADLHPIGPEAPRLSAFIARFMFVCGRLLVWGKRLERSTA